MWSAINFVFLCAICVGLTQAQVTLDQCNTKFITPHHFLNMSKFLGVWYNLKIGPDKADQVNPGPSTIKCMLANLTATDNDNVVLYQEPFVRLDANGTVIGPDMVQSHAHIGLVTPDNPLPSIWALKETYAPEDAPLGHVVIVASDEETFAIEYSCILRSNDLLQRISLWSRKPTLDPLVEKTLDDVMYAFGFPKENVKPFDQSDCPW